MNGASARLDQINNRVSAIDRYMTLSAPQLYGVNDVIANSGSTGINSSTVVGSSNTRADASAGIRTTNTTSITTYQVRATGGGGYATVPISGSQLNS